MASQEFSLGEIVGGAIWVASLIEVASYTYTALSATFTSFPTLDSGGGSIGEAQSASHDSPLKKMATNTLGASANILHKLPVIGGALDAADKFFGSLLTTNYVSQDEVNRLSRLKTPPDNYVKQLANAKRAINSGKATQTQLNNVNAFSRWALGHGWKQSDVSAYLKYLGINVL